MTQPIVRDPIYCQLNERLRAMLRTPDFPAGGRFLTERQVSERFAVSRPTANKALSALVAEGLLQFRKGVGTFVTEARLDTDLRALVSFTEKARAAGKRPETRTLSLRLVAAGEISDAVAAALELALEDEVYDLERLRLADGQPVILERRQLVARYCPNLDEAALEGSLYALLSERYRLEIAGAEQTIRSVALTAAESAVLHAAPGAAGLLVIGVGYLSGGIPLWREETLYRGDAYEFRNRLGPLATARPAAGALR
jgi:GntR family transcriptional regulator